MHIDVHIELDKYTTSLIITVIFIAFLTSKNPAIALTIAEFLDIIANSFDIIEFINKISTHH